MQTVNTKVLVVDDNQINLMLAEELLKNYSIETDTAENGEDALLKTKDQPYDIIFMDHMMPIMDGIEATRRIRRNADNSNRATPIIALTANAVQGMREFFLANQMDDYVSKPIDIDELTRVIQKWLPPDKIRI
jgi:CheY-like chemotaxis protein